MARDLFIIPNNDPLNLVPDHVVRMLALLASQFDDSVLLKGFIRAFALQVQDLQNAAEQLYYERSLNTAVGIQLDGIGEILNVLRLQGESDDLYRERLRFKSFLIFSSGTPEQIMYILETQSEASFVEYFDIFPAAYQMYTNGGLNFPDNTGVSAQLQQPHSFISKLLWQASPAAVQFVPVTCSYGYPIVFAFGPDILDSQLYVNTDTEQNLPLIKSPGDNPYYVNSGQSGETTDDGGYGDLAQYNILGLDSNSVLELDDMGNLLLYDDTPSQDLINAGQYAELLYYSE